MTLNTTDTIVISRIPVPESVDAPDARPFLEMVRLANEVCEFDAGHDDLREEPTEMLGFWHDQTDWTQEGYYAEVDGTIVGAAKLMMSNEPGAATVHFDVMVDPHRWGEGIEEALLAKVEEVARERGRLTIQTWTIHRPDNPGPTLSPSSRWGRIPAEDRQTVFQVENGFTLSQVERNSAFDLAADPTPLERMLAEAQAVAGPEYHLVLWTSPTPAEWREGFAYALSRMSTDTPVGDMVIEEEHWDVARVERRDARLAAQGLTVSVAAVVHQPTGVVAAYNELTIAEDPAGVTHQYGTLVLREHRGRRLGTIVKCANLLRWREVAPRSPKVSTFNAEENRHMLDINEAIGFVPVSYGAAWKKVLEG